MSSDRAVFIIYSSALLMRVMELRRRQGTRNTPFLSLVSVPPFAVSELLSVFGVHGCICILSSRGRMFRKIWKGQRVIQRQIDSCWLCVRFSQQLIIRHSIKITDGLVTHTHLSNLVWHFVSVRCSQGNVEDYHTVHHYHGGHWHHKHDIPAVKSS